MFGSPALVLPNTDTLGVNGPSVCEKANNIIIGNFFILIISIAHFFIG